MGKVVMLGRLRDLAGWRERDMEIPETIDALVAALSRPDPALGEALRSGRVQIAVNKIVVRGDHPLSAQDEVAFLPPMSGG